MDTSLSEIYNYDQVTEWLGTSGQPKPAEFTAIAQAGYKAVINLALPTSDNALADEGSLVSGHGMTYIHIPVDFAAPALEDLRLFFGAMHAVDGHKVWVHCAMNLRVSAFVFHYLRHVKGLDADAASTRILHKWRPRMDDVWKAFLALPDATIKNYTTT